MDWVQAIRDVGFPIIVALILLLKLDRSLNNLRESIEGLKKVILKEADRGGKE